MKANVYYVSAVLLPRKIDASLAVQSVLDVVKHVRDASGALVPMRTDLGKFYDRAHADTHLESLRDPKAFYELRVDEREEEVESEYEGDVKEAAARRAPPPPPPAKPKTLEERVAENFDDDWFGHKA